jgi:Tol biopolymer transport system component
VLRLDSGELRILAEGVFSGRYVPSGHIVYPQGGRLIALPFDVATLSTTGDPVDVTEPGMGNEDRDPYQWGFSLAGTLVYAPVKTGFSEGRELMWKDYDGNEEPLRFPAPPRGSWVRVSPDGKRLASSLLDPVSMNHDVWIHDLESGTSTRLTFDPGVDGSPVWTPDGQRIVFPSDRGGSPNLYWKDAYGVGDIERLTESQFQQTPRSWSRDGAVLLYDERGDPDLKVELWALYLDEDPPRPSPLMPSPFEEIRPALSPDGGWLAYTSNRTGTWQVWVSPFPAMDRQWPVSVHGGDGPRWHPQGGALYFTDLEGRLMEVKVRTEPEFSASRARVVFDDPRTPQPWGYDITPDGERFLLVRTQPQDPITELIVVENWFEVLKQKAPPGR